MREAPALTIAAVAPLPEEISELILASLLLGEKLKIQKNTNVSPLPVVADADFLIQGVIPLKFENRKALSEITTDIML